MELSVARVLRGFGTMFRRSRPERGGFEPEARKKSSRKSRLPEVPKFAEDHSGRLTFACRNVQGFLYILLFIIYYIISYVSYEHPNLLVSTAFMICYYSLC